MSRNMCNNNKQTVLLLGAYGFLGTNVMKYVDAHDLPYRFVTFDRTASHPAGITFRCIAASYAGDFTNPVALEQPFLEQPIDIVIHSLSTTVPLAVGSVRYDVETNLLPTITLMDCMVRHQVQKLVFFSSGGAVYGDAHSDKPHKETDELYPKSSYGVVKLAIEKYLFLYKSLYGLCPMVLRLSNPYGQWHYSQKQGIVNIALRAARQGETFTVWGDGTTTKDYIYADDVCAMLFQLMERGAYGETVNIASGELLSVNDILCRIKCMYPHFTWKYQPANAHDILRVSLDTTRLYQLMGGDFVVHTFDDVIRTI